MRGLVLAGGGSRGSWEAGCLKFLATVMPGFEFVSGTSVGAINAAGIVQYKPEQFKEAADKVEEMWTKHITKTGDVWSLRFPVGIPGLWNPSVGKNDQLEKLLTDLVDVNLVQDSGIQVRFAAVDVEKGELVIYTGQDLLIHGVKPIMASASYPAAFPPVDIEDRWLTDGGVRDTAPLGAAIKAGCDDIVILTTRDPNLVDFKDRAKMGNTVSFAQRCLSIQFHEVLQNDLKWCKAVNKWAGLESVLKKHGVPDDKVDAIVDEMGARKKKVKLTVFYPSKSLGTSLDFSGDMMQAQIQQGYDDAKAAWEAMNA